MAEKRFLVLSDDPTGHGVGAYRFGDVAGYGIIDFDDLGDAKVFCHDEVSRFRRLRVVDRYTYTGKTIGIVYEVPSAKAT